MNSIAAVIQENAPPARPVEIRLGLSRRRLGFVLLIGIAVLVALGLAVNLVTFATGRTGIYGLLPLFDLDREANVPTYVASILLLACAVLLQVISWRDSACGRPFRWHWSGLAVIFAVMSLDEVAGLHELLIRPMGMLGASGWFFYGWVIPGLAFVAAVGMSCVPLLRALPSRTAFLLALAGFVYVGGALGMEMIGGRYVDASGIEDLAYRMITTIEEGLELAGLALLLHTLTDYLALGRARLELTIRIG